MQTRGRVAAVQPNCPRGMSIEQLQATVAKAPHGATLHGPLSVTTNYNRLLEVYPADASRGFIDFDGERHFRDEHFNGANWMARFEDGRWIFRDTIGGRDE